MSQHTKRRRARQRVKGKVASLNLVSLMDIFTILVFFLMVNSSEVEVLQTAPDTGVVTRILKKRRNRPHTAGQRNAMLAASAAMVMRSDCCLIHPRDQSRPERRTNRRRRVSTRESQAFL